MRACPWSAELLGAALSAWAAAGPDADGLAAPAQLLLALILQALEECRAPACRARGNSLDQRVADDEGRVEAARQPLQAARGVHRVADDGEGQAVGAADIADDGGAIIEADADCDRRLADTCALLIPGVERGQHALSAAQRVGRIVRPGIRQDRKSTRLNSS